jgi:hypothetical protein
LPGSDSWRWRGPRVKLWLIFAGGLVGVVLTLAPVLLPKYQEYLPSAAAFGLAWVFPWYYGFLFFLGALVALLFERRNPKLANIFDRNRPIPRAGLWSPIFKFRVVASKTRFEVA